MDKKSFYVDKLAGIISQIQYLTIATITPDGKPWNTPVFSAFDGDLNFYWSSSPKSQHSQNIANKNRVFVVIYKSVIEQGSGWGVYMQGSVQMLAQDDIDNALKLLGERRNKPFENRSSFGEGMSQSIYKFTPEKVWINDAKKDSFGEFIEDYRVEIELDELKQSIGKHK